MRATQLSFNHEFNTVHKSEAVKTCATLLQQFPLHLPGEPTKALVGQLTQARLLLARVRAHACTVCVPGSWLLPDPGESESRNLGTGIYVVHNATPGAARVYPGHSV